MSKIGWDDQGDEYTAWDRIRDERRAERAAIVMEARQGRDGEARLYPQDDSTGREASPGRSNHSTTRGR